MTRLRLPTGISARLQIVFGALIVVSMSALGIRLVEESQRAVSTSILRDYQEIAVQAAGRLEAFLDRPVGYLSATAGSISILRGDLWKVESVLTKLKMEFPIFSTVVLTDTTGKGLVTTDTGSSPADWSHEQAFQAAVQGQRFVSPVLFDEAEGPHTCMAVPVMFRGRAVGTLCAKVNMQGLWDLVDSIHIGRTGRASVVSREGTTIAAPAKGDAVQGTVVEGIASRGGGSFSEEYVDRGGQSRLRAYAPIANVEWGILVEQPASEAYAFGKKMKRDSLLAVLVGVAVALALAVANGRSVIRPIRRLLEGTLRVARGDLDHTVHYYGKDEIGQLASSFNKMTASLKRAKTELVEERRFVGHILEHSPIGILTIDPEGFVTTANASLVALAGGDGDIKGKRVSDIPFLKALGLERFLEGREQEALLSAPTAGAETIYQIRRSILAQAGSVSTIVLVDDVTERKRAEEALVQERAQLAHRVEERTEELSAANAELARTSRLKDEFLANMSHELRTPLNAILGLSESLQEGVYGPVEGKQLESLLRIEQSGQHLLELINDILDVAKLESGKVELEVEQVPVASICQASLGLVKGIAGKKRLKVSLNLPSAVTTVQADSRRLKQILVNLLTNAVKFTPEKGEIGLDVAGDANTQMIHFTVWDTGIGISSDDVHQLFRPFVQLGAVLKGGERGTGLGLALVQRLANLHGGRVTLESEVGRGSRFTVSLPWRGPDLGAGPAVDEELALQTLKIGQALIIGDETPASEQVARYLDEAGVRNVVHPRGEGAVDKALELQPDVVLLGIPLPDGPGWDVLERLKEEPRTQAIPVILISAADERARALEMGAGACLVRPVSSPRLAQALSQVLSKGQPEPRGLPQGPRAAGEACETPPLILLAEDNENNIQMISDYLLAKGYRVVVARNGREAVERAQEDHPGLILMDTSMPVLGGLEATRCIRAAGGDLTDLPIIALTALAMAGDRERCLEAGASEYMSKPVNLKQLVRTIEKQLRRPRERSSGVA